MRKRKGQHKTWQDLYYDGEIEYEDDFCEETRELIELDKNHGWDDIEEAAIDLWKGKY